MNLTEFFLKNNSEYPIEYRKLSDNFVILKLENQTNIEKIKSLESQMINQQEQDNQIIIDLQNKNQYLELKYDDILKESLESTDTKKILEEFEKCFSMIFERFSNIKDNFLEQTLHKYSDENLCKFQFLKYLFEKFEDDNMWLVGKLKELTQQNLELDRKLKIYEENPLGLNQKTVKNILVYYIYGNGF